MSADKPPPTTKAQLAQRRAFAQGKLRGLSDEACYKLSVEAFERVKDAEKKPVVPYKDNRCSECGYSHPYHHPGCSRH